VAQQDRRSPRFPFVAVAEIWHKSRGRLSSQVAALSLNGCYVDISDTLHIGSEVSIKILAESECFFATALSNSDVGLAFEDVSLKSGTILREWLLIAADVSKTTESPSVE